MRHLFFALTLMCFSILFILPHERISKADQESANTPQIASETKTSIEGNEDYLCPLDMVEVKGNYCPEVIEKCIDLDKTVHNINGFPRCLKFEAPIQCVSKTLVPMHFCIDRYELPNQKGVNPTVMLSWYDVKKTCEAEDKRLCLDTEWTFACTGEDNLPYPNGYERGDSVCNIDHSQRPWFDASKSPMTPEIVARLNQSAPSGSMSECVSVFGVFDLTGNADEWVKKTGPGLSETKYPYVSGLKGGHWVKGARNRCRPRTDAHGPSTVFYELGGRCCKNIEENEPTED